MTDQGPRGLIPGQSVLRPRAPYGMTPGVRSVLPGVNDMSETAWNKPPTPDTIDLDAPISNPPPPGAQPGAGQPEERDGWELTMPGGGVVHLRSGVSKKRDAEQVQALGQALLNHAVSDGDKAAAGRAMEWGMGLVGKAPAAEITKQMAHMWDQGSMDDLKVELQGMRSKANRGGTGGVPAPSAETPLGLPDPMTKFGHTIHKDMEASVNAIMENERKNAKYMAMSEHENQMNVMDSELSSGNAMAERGAVMRRLLEMTGKASRESEQAGITASAGKWAELKNRLALWVPGTNPSLDRAYIGRFKEMIAVDRAAIRRAKEQLGRDAATRALEQIGRAYGPEAAQEAAHTVYGAISGNSQSRRYEPRVGAGGIPPAAPRSTQPQARPAPAPASAPKDEYSDLD